MIAFKTTTSFRLSIESMLKVKRGVYSGVEKEIKEAFRGKSMQDILTSREMIQIKSSSVVVKFRLKDSKRHLSKSDGYRLIYAASKDTDTVVFMDIYPKIGPKQKLNISEQELDCLLDEATREALENRLQSFDID